MTPDQIAAIAARLQAVTHGLNMDERTTFIANAPTDIAALLAVCDRLRAERDARCCNNSEVCCRDWVHCRHWKERV